MLWCGDQVLQSHLKDLKQVQTVVNRSEQQSGQDVLNSLFKTFTDGLETDRRTESQSKLYSCAVITIMSCWYLRSLSSVYS